MCRNIKTLANFEPPASAEEIHAAALQFVRKVSGSTKPSKINSACFEHAVIDITDTISRLLIELETQAPPKNREAEAIKVKQKNAKRFGINH